jgi:zinc transporter ZupT
MATASKGWCEKCDVVLKRNFFKVTVSSYGYFSAGASTPNTSHTTFLTSFGFVRFFPSSFSRAMATIAAVATPSFVASTTDKGVAREHRATYAEKHHCFSIRYVCPSTTLSTGSTSSAESCLRASLLMSTNSHSVARSRITTQSSNDFASYSPKALCSHAIRYV